MTISVRIISLDHCMADPGPLDRSYTPFSDKKLDKVPVLRIYGSTKAGQKICLYIHQVFPYFFVPYTIPTEYTTEEEIQKEIFQFGTSLNEAMNLARPNAKKDQHIAAIVLTKGVPFYGYHVGYQTYLKIYMANPHEKQQMRDVLQSGAIQNKLFQLHEAHLNFELQFLIDHNLYGMNWIHIEEHGLDKESASFGIQFRLPLPSEPKASYTVPQSSSNATNSISHTEDSKQNCDIYTSKTIPPQLQSDKTQRTSYCELELDITGMSILNRLDLKERDIHSTLKGEEDTQSQALQNAEQESRKKLVKSLESIWKDEISRRKLRGITEPIPPVAQLDQREPLIPWLSEPAHRRLMEKMMTGHMYNENLEVQQASPLLSHVMTTFQAIEALYPDEYFEYEQAKKNEESHSQQQLELPLQQQTKDEGDSDSKEHSILELPSSPSRHGTITPGRASPPPSKSTSQFNVSATPSRYRTWDLPSQIDRAVIDSFIEDANSSFYQDDAESIRDQEEHSPLLEEDKKGQESDDLFDDEGILSNSDIAKWLEEIEEKQHNKKQHKTQVIAYDTGGDPVTYQPRRLDFAAESQRIDSILQAETVVKKDILDFMEEKNTGSLQISEIPPDSMPRVPKKTSRSKRLNIEQLDGASDDKNEHKRHKTASERWEEEKKLLRKIRLKKAAVQQSQKTPNSGESTSSFSSILENERRSVTQPVEKTRESSQELHPKGFQKVTVVIPRFIPKKRKKMPRQSTQRTTAEPKTSPLLPSNTIKQASMSQPNRVSTQIRLPEPVVQITSKRPSSSVQSKSTAGDAAPKIDSSDRRKKEESDAHLVTEGSNKMQFSSPAFCSPKDIAHEITQLPMHQPDELEVNKVEKAYVSPPLPHSTVPSPSMDTKKPLVLATATHSYRRSKEYVYCHPPPVVSEKEIENQGVVYQEPFYSKPSDMPRFPTVFAGKEFKVPTIGLPSLKEFESLYGNIPLRKDLVRIKAWSPSQPPPSLKQVEDWLKAQKEPKIFTIESKTQLQQPTPDNTFNFRFSTSKPVTKMKKARDYIDYFSVEIHVNTREKLLPDPSQDPVKLIFWCLQTENKKVPSNGYQEDYCVGVVAMKDIDVSRIGLCDSRILIDYAESEEELFSALIGKVRYYDPHMLVGYEIQSASWGYLVERGAYLGYNMLNELSREIEDSDTIQRDPWGYKKASAYRVTGRHMLNIWRLMRGELSLTSYTFENIAYNLLHDRIPYYSHETLTSWYQKGPAILKYRLFKHYMKRVQLNMDILDASQIISRMCESARVYGIDFYAVISRGSQYNVESMMFRIAKPENFVLITPSREQVASQRSLEVLPLIMEPVSQFYSSPMVVLDFQSLYPSVMIAYNYCYSTCLGRIRKPEESSRFGVLPSFSVEDGLLDALKDHINISPNGVMFVKPEIRKSLLAKMLTELLDTRVMIKRSMKDYKDDSGLLRILDAKQLTLKLLANVTYGYTSASFSGRMPSVEIADSIVATGRKILERAIQLINETEKWGAKVVYGDTDSMFIHFPGKTREQAFVLGNEIAETVTKMNPAPIKLKFEKVYHPTVLLAKKRYMGFKYEDPSDTEPTFEAKGIETVRRDGTNATQKLMESCLKILFRTQDMSELKSFLYHQWTKILSNRVPLQDFIISKEVRMGTYSERGGPNGAIIAQERMNVDARSEPQYGERVPYVVVYRGPNTRLKDQVVRPEVLLNDSSLRLDAEYYIRKQIIPPLSRVFNLMGVDILSWYESMPRSLKLAAMNLALSTERQTKYLRRIDQYYSSSHCIVCRKVTDEVICQQCQEDKVSTAYTLCTRQRLTQDRLQKILQICYSCSHLSPMDISCESLDCPIFYERLKAREDARVTSTYDSLLESLE